MVLLYHDTVKSQEVLANIFMILPSVVGGVLIGQAVIEKAAGWVVGKFGLSGGEGAE
jgi:hypothetical protein